MIKLILIITFICCQGLYTFGQTTFDNTEKSYQTIEYLKFDNLYICQNSSIEPSTFSKQTNVYSKPDTLSEIFGILPFNSTISLVEEATYDSKCQFFAINFNNKIGFVRPSDIILKTFSSLGKEKQFKYFIDSYERNVPVLYKYDLQNNLLLDTFEIEDFHLILVSQLNSNKWENVDALFYIQNDGGCCGCTNRGIYLIDANGKIKIIFGTSDYIDDGGEGGENYSTINIELPLNPKHDNIIYSEYEQTGLYDQDDNPIFDQDGNIKIKITKDIKKYYKWDGFKIVELKNIK